jgi:hypothetical protein
MNEIHRSAAGGLIVALTVLVGCGSEASAPGGSQAPSYDSPEKVEQSIQQSLARLRALQTVEVRDLVSDLPAEARACYGLCEGWKERYQAERARQAPRVARLATLAEAAADDTSLAPRSFSEADAALRALAGLEIVEVTGLIEVKPANNPLFYNQPSPEDTAAANRLNAAHVAQVFAVVDAAHETGL